MAKSRIEKLDRNLQPAQPDPSKAWQWVSAGNRRLTLRGLPWFGENRGCFCRLPLRAQDKVREPVWQLAQSPAGACVAFRTDSSRMTARVTNRDTAFMAHMPLTGSHGLALYCGEPARMRPWGTAIPEQQSASFERPLFDGLSRKVREFRLYLPLYQPLQKLELGFEKGARLLKPSPAALDRPVVFYGTSITQGGCANTAGTDFVSTVGRMLNLETVNLGFSGNGKGDPELAELMTEIDAALYVLDYAANVDPAGMQRTLGPFIRILRAKRPDTPIAIMSNIVYSRYDFQAGLRDTIEARRDIMMKEYLACRRKGDRNIHFIDGFGLVAFGADSATVDGAHLTDHGFRLMADRLAPALEMILLRQD